MSHSGNCQTRSASASDSNQLRQVMCSIHPGHPCHHSILCGQGNQSKYFHPKTWKHSNLLAQLQPVEPAANIQPESCLCRPCRDDVSRIHNANLIPRWRKTNQTKLQCCHPGCGNTSYKTTKLATKARVFAS